MSLGHRPVRLMDFLGAAGEGGVGQPGDSPSASQGSTEGCERRRDEAEPLLPRDLVARSWVSRASPDKWGELPGLHKGAAAHPPEPPTAAPPPEPLTPGLHVQFLLCSWWTSDSEGVP